MIEHMVTGSGLKYWVSTDKLNEILLHTDEDRIPNIKAKIDETIEAAEILPLFCSYASYIGFSLLTDFNNILLICISLFIHIIAVFMSHNPKLFRVRLINHMLHIYSKFMLAVPIVIIGLGIINGTIVRNVVFIVLDYLLNTVLKFTVDTYEKRLPFNDKVYYMVLEDEK